MPDAPYSISGGRRDRASCSAGWSKCVGSTTPAGSCRGSRADGLGMGLPMNGCLRDSRAVRRCSTDRSRSWSSARVSWAICSWRVSTLISREASLWTWSASGRWEMGNEQAVEAGSLSFSGAERACTGEGTRGGEAASTAEMPGADGHASWLPGAGIAPSDR